MLDSEKWKCSQRDEYEWIDFSGSNRDVENLKKYQQICVYGAGKYGKVITERLLEAGQELKGILVSAKEGNPDELCGIPVFEYDMKSEDIYNLL